MPVASSIAPERDTGRERQDALGQFLTPPPVGELMASFFAELPAHIRLVDAGAGAGALTLALVRRVCAEPGRTQSIEVTVYEKDPLILHDLEQTLRTCAGMCKARCIRFAASIQFGDFIQEASRSLAGDLFGAAPLSFNAAIVNPPYKKINTGSPERKALRQAGIETSNLYAGFIALLVRMLEPGGQIVAITPRSFCNGPYFQPFREDFLARMNLLRIHIFESRQAAFRKDAVLQENIIFHGIRGEGQGPEVKVSSSSGEAGDTVRSKDHPFSDIVHSGDPARFIHVPADTIHTLARARLAALRTPLASLGLSVSTGRVVDFRLKEALRPQPGAGTVPLLYPCHFNEGGIRWPRPDARKPNAILDDEQTRPWLVPSGCYLLTKRFTSKEERRRLVACLYEPGEGHERLGFENHLNYFHAQGQGLDPALARGLFVYLNSTLVDQYFRSFSGHTQVNATDLRKLPYPSPAALMAMGAELKNPGCVQTEIG